MRRRLFILTILPALLTGCFTSRAQVHVYSQSIDLQEVAKAFSQSRSIVEFEEALNDPYRHISNLDLDSDGYVDYLRVVEFVDGPDHVFNIDAALGEDYFRNVATIIAHRPLQSDWIVEVVGSHDLFGPDSSFIPVFRTRPYIFASFRARHYKPWHSPWRWNHYPPEFRHRKPHHPGHHPGGHQPGAHQPGHNPGAQPGHQPGAHQPGAQPGHQPGSHQPGAQPGQGSGSHRPEGNHPDAQKPGQGHRQQAGRPGANARPTVHNGSKPAPKPAAKPSSGSSSKQGAKPGQKPSNSGGHNERGGNGHSENHRGPGRR